MRSSQCPYFLGSCPLVSVTNADQPLPPPPPPPPPSNEFNRQANNLASGASQLVSPSLSSYQGFVEPPSPSLQGTSLGQPSLFERRKQYKNEMLKNQVERQGGQRYIPPTASTSTASSSSSSSASFPTSSYCLPPSLSSSMSRSNSSEVSPISNYRPTYQPNPSNDFDNYPSASSSSSSNPYPLPFDDNLYPPPSPYLYQNQSGSSSGGYTNLLQIDRSPPVLFHQPPQPVDDDEYLSSSTASFPYSPDFYGGGDFQEPSHGSLEFEDGLVHPEPIIPFSMQGLEETPATRQEFVRVVEKPAPREKPVGNISQASQGKEHMLGEQTAFISKLWHVITHVEYTQFLRWSKDGKSFVLLDPENFAAVVLPRFFRHSKLTSFVRQLNLYSFQRVSVEYLQADESLASPSQSHHSLPPSYGSTSAGKSVIASGFSHPSFQRNHPELLNQLHPRVPGKKPTKREEESRKGSSKRPNSSTRGVGRS